MQTQRVNRCPDFMSYENEKCPCGDKKLTDTMLCTACEGAVAGTFDRAQMENFEASLESRRNAAIRVLAVARRRNSYSLPVGNPQTGNRPGVCESTLPAPSSRNTTMSQPGGQS